MEIFMFHSRNLNQRVRISSSIDSIAILHADVLYNKFDIVENYFNFNIYKAFRINGELGEYKDFKLHKIRRFTAQN
jgi:hypothetical protein